MYINGQAKHTYCYYFYVSFQEIYYAVTIAMLTLILYFMELGYQNIIKMQIAIDHGIIQTKVLI